MERPKVYLDANVFLYVFLGTGENHGLAKSLLSLVEQGKFEAHTCALTYDEVFWKVKQMRSFEDALKAAKLWLSLPNLNILSVTAQTVWKANDLQSKYGTKPRDAIHAAAAIMQDIKVIISDDPDFDKIKELKRKKL